MAVLKQTSPTASPTWPTPIPLKTVPSASASTPVAPSMIPDMAPPAARFRKRGRGGAYRASPPLASEAARSARGERLATGPFASRARQQPPHRPEQHVAHAHRLLAGVEPGLHPLARPRAAVGAGQHVENREQRGEVDVEMLLRLGVVQ